MFELNLEQNSNSFIKEFFLSIELHCKDSNENLGFTNEGSLGFNVDYLNKTVYEVFDNNLFESCDKLMQLVDDTNNANQFYYGIYLGAEKIMVIKYYVAN